MARDRGAPVEGGEPHEVRTAEHRIAELGEDRYAQLRDGLCTIVTVLKAQESTPS